MAKKSCTLKYPDEFAKKLSKLGDNADEISKKAVAAGGEAALPIVKEKLQSVIGQGTKYESRSTGAVLQALGVSGPRVNRDGDYDVRIGFADTPRRDGKRNGFVAAMIEYGAHGVPAKPFMKPSKTKAKKAAIAAASKVFDQEVEKIAK